MEDRIIANGLTRREFVKAALAGTAALAVSSAGIPSTAWAQRTSPFGVPPLPYAEDALAPVISARTVGFHYGKHHLGYLYNLNDLVQNTALRENEPRGDHQGDGRRFRENAPFSTQPPRSGTTPSTGTA